ncbi:VCBS domain-containing protein, partial [Vibrio breoganii]
HGTVVIDENGNWTFTANNQHHDIQALAAGDSLTEVVTVTSKDGTAHQDITITINGNNDVPTIGGASVGRVKEDASHPDLTTSGQLTIRDTDTGESFFKTDSTSIAHGADTWGTLTIDRTGHWHYSVDNEHRVQHLQEGAPHIDIFTVHSADGTSHQVEVTITGTKDAPKVALKAQDSDTATVIESGSTPKGQAISGTQSATGHLTGTDIDDGDTQAWSVVNPLAGHSAGDGVYGHLIVDGNGRWTYTLDNTKAVTEALTQGHQETETFIVRVTDSTGLTADHKVTVQVTGSNDQAHITGKDSETLTEDTALNSQDQLHTSGDLAVTDVDKDEAHFQVGTISGQYGSLTVDANGHWHYEADNNQPAIQELKATDSLKDSITVLSTDGTKHQVVIFIDGTNDLPTIDSTHDTGSVVEAGSSASERHKVTPDAGTLTVSDTLVAHEVDKLDPPHWAVTNGQGHYGSLTIDPDTGKWTYTIDNARANSLHQGEVQTENFEVTDTDSSKSPVSHTVTITVTGSNDMPVISGKSTALVVEKGDNYPRNGNRNHEVSTVSGQLHAVDPDNSEHLTWSIESTAHGHNTSQSLDGSYGSLTIDPDTGLWTYTVDNAKADALRLGEHHQEKFNVLVQDSSRHSVMQKVVVTVYGANDNPVLSAYTQQNVDEGDAKQDFDIVGMTDVDHGDTHTYSTTNKNPWVDINSRTGTVTLDPRHTHFDHLSVGESETVLVPVTVKDNHGGHATETLKIVVHGTNDAPYITSVNVTKVVDSSGTLIAASNHSPIGDHTQFSDVLNLNEDNIISGKVNFADVDDEKDTNHPHGDTHTFTAIIEYTDEHGQKHTKTMVDAGFTINGQGEFELDATAPLYQHLQKGQSANIDATVVVTDGQGESDTQHIHFTVHGQNDNPTVNQVAALQVDEDNAIRFTLGKTNPNWGNSLLQISDIENDKLDVFNPTIDPKYGRLVDHGMGRFEFIPASNENADTFPGEVPVVFKIDDNHGGVVTERGYIHVNPVNDAPNARNVGLSSIDEDSSAIHISEADLLAHTSDIDNQDTDLHVTSLQLKTAGAGQLVKDPNGGWLFTPSANWNSHKFGTDVKFSFTVSDGDTNSNIQHGGGGTPSAVATLHVNPLPDPALIVPDNAHPQDLSVTDGSDLVAEGYLTVSDPDKDESHFTATSSIPGTHGFASIDRNGHWHYTLNDKDPAVLALGAGEHMLDKVVFRSTDGTPHTINIDITGKNEAPEVTQVDTIVAVEDGKPVIGKLHVDDKDTTDMLHFSLDKPVPGLAIDPDTGVYTFEPTATFYNHLREGQVEVISAVVSVTDSSGATIKDTIEIRVTGTNDAPEATGVPMPNLYLDDTHGTQIAHPKAHFSDQMFLDRATDPDRGDVLSVGKLSATGAGATLSDVHLHDSSVGTLKQDGQGGYDFIPAAHFTGHVEIDYTVTDGIASTPMHTSFEVVRHAPLLPNSGSGNNNQGNNHNTPPDVDKFEHDVYHTTIAEGGDKVTGTVHQVHVSGTHSSHDDVYGANHLQPNAHGDGSPAYGYLKLQPNGDWEYHLNQHNSPTDPINQLAVGETATETFIVRGPNAAPTTLVLTITGTNDAPEITRVEQHIENAQNQQISGTDIAEVDTTHVVGQITARDIDHGDTLSYGTGVPTDSQGNPLPKEFLDGNGHLAGLTVDGHGGYTFIPDSARFGTIPPGQTRVFKVPVEVTDGHGGSDTQIVTLTVMGHNRPPVVANSDIHLSSQTEDFGTHTVSAQQLLTLAGASDPDGDPLHVTHLKITGTNGAPVTVRDDGQGNFIFSSKQDQHGDLHFSFEVTDGMPHSQVQKVTATLPVTAVNDKPVASDFKLGSVAESTTAAPTATHVFTESQFLAHVKDSDIATDSDKLHLTGTPTLEIGDQAKGRFEVSGNGNGYRFVPTDPNFHGTVHVTYEVKDSAGATTSALAAIEVTATNDPAIIANPTPDYAQEDIKGSASGKLGIIDVDTPNGGAEEHFHANSHIGGQFGYLQLDRDGNWNYVLTRGDKPGVQQLSAIGKLTEHFHITSQDGTKYDLTVEVRGTNDDPVLNVIAAINGKEGGNTLSGQIHATDVDTQGSRTIDNPADVLTYETQYTHAGFSLNSATGAYSLDLKDPVFEHLAQGEKETLTVPVTVTDNNGGSSHTRNLVITVTGTNDVPVLDAITQITKNEDDAVVTGQLSSHDVDSDNLQGQHTTYHLQGNQVAGFTLNPDGSYSFDPHAYNALKAGEHKDITIPIIARDNHGDSAPQNLVIHLTGTNDAPTITGTSTATVTDGPSISAATTTTEQQLQITDPDHGEAHFVQDLNVVPDSTSANSSLQQSAYGHLSITKDGRWLYHVDTPDAIKAIPHGETVTETFTVHSADGTPQSITVNIEGTNNAAVITGDVTTSVTEDQIYGMQWLLFTGHMHVVDPDAGESEFDPVYPAHNYAGIGYTSTIGAHVTLTQSGTWHYQLDNNNPTVQALGVGETYIDKVTVHTVDGTTQELQITIHGTNDVPKVSSPLTLSNHGVEDTDLTISKGDLLANATDVDSNDVLHIEHPVVDASKGTVSLDKNGNVIFHPVQNFNGDVTVTYQVVDSHGAKVTTTATFTVDSVNDHGVFASDDTGAVQEDVKVQGNTPATVFTTGVLTVTDPDAGESYFVANHNVHATHDPYGGSLSIDKAGAWTYSVPNSNIQSLREGQSVDVTYQVSSTGGDSHEITVTITGTNDAPTVSHALTTTLNEDSSLNLRPGMFGFADADQGDTLHSISLTSIPDPATEGQLLLNGNPVTSGQAIAKNQISHLVFNPVTNFNGDVHFGYKVSDGHADSTEQTATLHVAPVNDPAQIGVAASALVREDSPTGKTAGTLSIVDPDGSSEEVFTAASGLHGQYGDLDIDEHGHWGYTMTKQSDPAIQGLKEGEILIDKITVHSQDRTAYEVQVQISGENDKPTVTATPGLVEQAGQGHSFKQADFGFHDIDGDSLNYITITSLPDAVMGQLMLNGHAVTAHQVIAQADLTHLTFENAQIAQDGQVATFQYTANDGHEDSDPATLSLTMHPTQPIVVTNNPAPPPPPPVSADEPDTGAVDQAPIITLQDLAAATPASSGAQAYLNQIGVDSHTHTQPDHVVPSDMDIVLAGSSDVTLDEHGLVVADADSADAGAADDHHKHHDELQLHDDPTIVHHDWTDNHG